MNTLQEREFYTIVGGGVLLAINAGYINVVALSAYFKNTVAHVTGLVSRVGIYSVNGDADKLTEVISILLCFGFGSFVSGYIIGDGKFKLNPTYGYILFLESFFLFLTYIFIQQDLLLCMWCAAFSMGLQNAMCTTYSGMAVRTTHMTGTVTDIGNILGQYLRKGVKAETWRLKVLFPLLFGFMLGGVFGQFAFLYFVHQALLVPVFIAGGVAVLYLSLPWVKEAGKQAEKVAEEALKIAETLDIPLIRIREDAGGAINPKRNQYQEKLTIEMQTFLADIDTDEGVMIDDLQANRKTSPVNPNYGSLL